MFTMIVKKQMEIVEKNKYCENYIYFFQQNIYFQNNLHLKKKKILKKIIPRRKMSTRFILINFVSRKFFFSWKVQKGMAFFFSLKSEYTFFLQLQICSFFLHTCKFFFCRKKNSEKKFLEKKLIFLFENVDDEKNVLSVPVLVQNVGYQFD